MSQRENHARRRTLVVAGLILGEDGRTLLSQRRADQSLPLQWELPGGKVEPGEGPQVALVRELEEELGIEVAVGRIWEVLFHPYPEFDLLMLVYRCRIARGVPRCVAVADIAWCAPEGLAELNIVAADRGFVERLAREGLPRWC